MELLKILAIFLLVFYGLKYLFRLLMPFALRKMMERLTNKAQQQQSAGGRSGTYSYTTGGNPFEQFKQQTPPENEGEVRVDYVPREEAKLKKGTQTAGEFIEFEEIK
ncbi:DUF4834 family protein [Sphingobacterium haloxyli]|uniref:DUF4834 domain-containing protein n=1 Tax=Sphingobacterium haloxyli TaxID=2100533 RepID=A0A2S9J8J1_9SPHI|nr:DUF4834 family protein [Sphingobacterium haloxyli]PRD49084.1 DUF4834 domain-containing protein [Sphingobacterium haloxyli]